MNGWDGEAAETMDAVRRLTDPAGPGVDLFRGDANLYIRRAHGRPDNQASSAA